MHSAIKRQRGATLLVSLIMLVVLTLFAVAGFNLSSVNLKITGNFQGQKAMEAVAQQAIEQVISSVSAFNLTPAASTVCVNGGAGCAGGYNVAVSAPKCNYSTTAKGYTKKVGELTPEDTDWEIRAEVTDPLTGAKAAIVQGVSIRMLAGNCPTL
jgi:Tfp pilus assembly protein PilX